VRTLPQPGKIAGVTRTVEAELADSEPFGSAGYIIGRLTAHYRHRVVLLTQHHVIESAFNAELDGASEARRRIVLGDPVVRMVIDRTVAHLRLGGEPLPDSDVRAVLSRASQELRHGPPAIDPPERQAPWGRTGPLIWSEEPELTRDASDDVFRKLFAELHQGLALRTADPYAVRMLASGMRLLRDLCPELASSMAAHVRMIAIVSPTRSGRVTSLTNSRLPGVVMYSPHILSTAWKAAEYLLHEAAHTKFIDIEHTHSLLASDYDDAQSPRIRPHWNRVTPGNRQDWPVGRALTVLHVYTCLAVFFLTAAERVGQLEKEYGEIGYDPAVYARRALDRAQYLKNALEQHLALMGIAGELFLRWIGALLRFLDAQPPLDGSYLHLLLDLYGRQADHLRAVALNHRLEEATMSEIGTMLGETARREIRAVQDAFVTIGRPIPSDRTLESSILTIGSFSTDVQQSISNFVGIRRALSGILQGAEPDMAAMSLALEETAPTEIIRMMVEQTSISLDPLFRIEAREGM
jgi:HEXXH motif-containing protein